MRIKSRFYDSRRRKVRETSRFVTQPSRLLQPEIISFVVPEALGSAEIDNYDIVAQTEIVTDGISMP